MHSFIYHILLIFSHAWKYCESKIWTSNNENIYYMLNGMNRFLSKSLNRENTFFYLFRSSQYFLACVWMIFSTFRTYWNHQITNSKSSRLNVDCGQLNFFFKWTKYSNQWSKLLWWCQKLTCIRIIGPNHAYQKPKQNSIKSLFV